MTVDAATAAAEKAAYRKASWRLLPLIALGYGIAYIDRTNISFASLQMNRDLSFSATIYGFGAGIFFLGYAACELPSNLLLYRFGARRWLARIMVSWGLVATAMMLSARRCSSTSRALRSAWLKPVSSGRYLLRFQMVPPRATRA